MTPSQLRTFFYYSLGTLAIGLVTDWLLTFFLANPSKDLSARYLVPMIATYGRLAGTGILLAMQFPFWGGIGFVSYQLGVRVDRMRAGGMLGCFIVMCFGVLHIVAGLTWVLGL